MGQALEKLEEKLLVPEAVPPSMENMTYQASSI